MAQKIVWRARALSNLNKTFLYLSEEWGDTVAERFIEVVQENIDLLLAHPESGAKSTKRPNRRKRVVKPRTSIIYELTPVGIIIIDIWDNRRKPK